MKERSRTEYSLLNIFVGLGGYLLNTILGFVCRMVFTRCLSADYLGISGLFTNVLSMLSLAELGISSAIVYALYKPLAEHDEEKIASLVKLYGTAYKIIGSIISIVGIMVVPFLKIIISDPPEIQESIYLLYIISLLNTSLTYFFSYRSSLLSAAQQNYIVTGVNYVITVTQSLIQIAWLISTHNYLGYVLIQSLGTLIYNILISHIAVRRYPYIAKKDIKPLSKIEKQSLCFNIRDLMIYKISSVFVNSTDNILITFFNGLTTTGLASNYTLLINTINTLLGNLFNAMTASVGNYNVLENEDKQYEMFSFLNMMNFWIFGWAALGIVFCSTDIVKLCFGNEYVLSFKIPLIMAVNFYLVGMLNAVWMFKNTLGLFRYGRFIQLILGILNIIFSVVLGTCWGLFGILLATTISRILTNTWYDPYAIFKHGFNKSPFIYVKRYMRYFFILSFAGILNYYLLKLISVPLVLKVLLDIISCSFITNLVFYIFLHNDKEFQMCKVVAKNIINIVFQKMKTLSK